MIKQLLICIVIKQMVICIMVNDLHNDHTLIFRFYTWEHLELKLKLKLSNMFTYINLLHYKWVESVKYKSM